MKGKEEERQDRKKISVGIGRKKVSVGIGVDLAWVSGYGDKPLLIKVALKSEGTTVGYVHQEF